MYDAGIRDGGPQSARSSIIRWALAGGVWGSVSYLLLFGGFFMYEGPLYRLGSRPLILLSKVLMPSWWVKTTVLDPLARVVSEPLFWWASVALGALLSITLGALAALGLRVVLYGIGAHPRPCDK